MKNIKLSLLLFCTLGLVIVIGAFLPSKAEAYHIAGNWVPTAAETPFTNECINARARNSGYTIYGAFPFPSSLTTTDGSAQTDLFAAAIICSGAGYTSVNDLRVNIKRFERYSGSGNISIGTQSPEFRMGNLTQQSRFTDRPTPKQAYFTNLTSGVSCWTIIFDGRGTYGNGTLISLIDGRWNFCIDVTVLNWSYIPTINPAAGMPAREAIVAPGDVITLEGRISNIGNRSGPAFNFRMKPNANDDPVVGARSTTHTELSNCTNAWSPQNSNTWANQNGTMCPGSPPYSLPGDAVQWGRVNYGGGGIAGIAAGQTSPIVRIATFRIRNITAAQNNSRVCFYAMVSNYNSGASGTDWRIITSSTTTSPERNRVCYIIQIPPTTTGWELAEENATLNGSVGNTCGVAARGTSIQFGSTIRNIRNNPVRNTTGDLVDVSVAMSTGSISNTSLTPVGPTTQTNVAIGNNETYRYPTLSYTVPNNAALGDVFTATVSYYEGNGSPSTTAASPEGTRFNGIPNGATENPGPLKAQACVRITDIAFMKVQGSGVYNGAVWRNLNECKSGEEFPLGPTSAVEGRVIGNIGTSAEYGVTSLGSDINGFGSGIVPGNSLGNDRARLSFANSGGLGNFLGAAIAPAKCLVDLYELFDSRSVLTRQWSTIRIAAAGVYSGSGDVNSTPVLRRLDPLDFNNMTGAPSDYTGKAVVLVDGDLNITDNIRYTANYGDFASLLRIPSLVFIVNGNINIAAGVQQLDGLFISVRGKINTCTPGAPPPDFLPAACSSSRLTVNGAFISNDVDFYRFIHGRQFAFTQRASLGIHEDAHASEFFNFSPELYIARPFAGLVDFNSNQTQDNDYYSERTPVY